MYVETGIAPREHQIEASSAKETTDANEQMGLYMVQRIERDLRGSRTQKARDRDALNSSSCVREGSDPIERDLARELNSRDPKTDCDKVTITPQGKSQLTITTR